MMGGPLSETMEQHAPASASAAKKRGAKQAGPSAVTPKRGVFDDEAVRHPRPAPSSSPEPAVPRTQEEGRGGSWGSAEPASGSGSGGGGGDEDGRMVATEEQEVEEREEAERGSNKKTRKKLLSAQKLARLKAAAERRGIVYVSRIPPHMKPMKLKQLLGAYGAVGRVYCAPEDPALRRLRKAKKGNSGKNFSEGWVEFEDKADAKRVALLLNGQQMGGKKRRWVKPCRVDSSGAQWSRRGVLQ